MIGFYDRSGRPISMEEWQRLLHDDAYRQVAVDELHGCTISTIWTGADLSAAFGGWAPRIFETAVLWRDGDVLEQERYATEAEALAGHELTVVATRALQGKLS